MPAAFYAAKASGAESFARVLPTVDGLLKSFSSSMPQENIAVLKPGGASSTGALEAALCRRWRISGVVSRESGGENQRKWQSICRKEQIDLWLISRPVCPSGIEIAYTLNELIDKIYLKIS